MTPHNEGHFFKLVGNLIENKFLPNFKMDIWISVRVVAEKRQISNLSSPLRAREAQGVEAST